MKRLFIWAFDYLIFGNWFISIAAISLTLETYLMIHKPLKIDGLLFFIFFSTLFEYNLHRQLSLSNNKAKSTPEKFNWALENPRLFRTTFYGSIFGLIVTAFFITPIIFFIIAPLGLITIGYSIPLIKTKADRIRLRELPGVKILFVALVWGFTTVLLPAIDAGLSLLSANVFFMLTRRILFVYAITIPFDIRDKEDDLIEGIKTLPILIGNKKSKVFAIVLMVMFCLLIFLQYPNSHDMNFSLPLYLSALTTAFLLLKSSHNNGKYFHYFWVDGTMIFQFLLILFFT